MGAEVLEHSLLRVSFYVCLSSLSVNVLMTCTPTGAFRDEKLFDCPKRLNPISSYYEWL